MTTPGAMDLKTSRGHPWSLGQKLRRAAWMLVWGLLGRPGPRAFSPMRLFLLRLFGARIGERVLVSSGVKVLMPWNLEIGEYTAIGEGVEIYNYGQVRIGKNSCVSQRVWLCTGTHDYKQPSFPLIWDDIQVGDGVWLAAETFVAPGVTIGDGAVVGARSVVTRDLEGWSVFAGNPCVLIKPRPRD
ncbi:WcaF family extracellular polysaccharide biosynthesis acetyltransferase [Variovorax saccharolyticus]|uniref:WcaF family extracellular polysaccharide biosynthesis acetyltransferase n=1 Tax=Variovorax saccharolyticus TaxID=3053516 RepID=UPI0025779904|nr:WcaF family extracellular polysaccharide biosynthesis acetyltransferase [Variovorax sp. J31P216]MDM0024930.1 WcaF family extracellular polysaccharide biosynthesis acetyltransferase [Variovorax sp. J31P216]